MERGRASLADERRLQFKNITEQMSISRISYSNEEHIISRQKGHCYIKPLNDPNLSQTLLTFLATYNI